MATTMMRKKFKKPVRAIAGVAMGPYSGVVQTGHARHKRASVIAENLLDRGCELVKKEIWDEAENDFRKALKMEADYAEALNNIALCMLATNRYQEAFDTLQECLKQFPGWFIAESNLGLACEMTERYDEAAAYYKKALDKQRAHPPIWLSLGDVYIALERPDDAANAYKTAITVQPRFGLAYFRLGMLQARREKIDDAEALLVKGLALEPKNAEATAVLGAIAARKGDLAKAKDLFTQVQQIEPIPAPAQRGLRLLQIFGQGLLKGLEEWKSGNPEPSPLAECFYKLGLAQIKANDRPGALTSFEKAADAQTDWALPRIATGYYAALSGNANLARKHWEAALGIDPQLGVLREQLGYLDVAMGLPPAAAGEFKKAQELGRNISPEAIDASQMSFSIES